MSAPGRGGWHTPIPDDHPAAALYAPAAIRKRCAAVHRHVAAGESEHFSWHPDRLDAAADEVVSTLRERYPTLDVPPHSRWRHFSAGGCDRWGPIAAGFGTDRRARARARCELAFVSVLLDAGAGPAWRYTDAPTKMDLGRSEGLAVATLRMYAAGIFSADARAPLRVDAAALAKLDLRRLAAGFGATGVQRMQGLEGRQQLLKRLGESAAATSIVFPAPARLGQLFDYFEAHASRGSIAASFVLETVLRLLAPVWPARLRLDGIPLGDCWRHPAAIDADAPAATQGYVPFHKLSQWLTYSLLEPLAEAGIAVSGQDVLTGLPEYRNGGLLLDAGVLVAREPELARRVLPVHDAAVVEWRAVTVVALDLLAERVCTRLGLAAAEFPLAKLLEGGTWAAGRRLAGQRRPGGAPPLTIDSDGTVF
jgi:hypothetical protein